MKKIRGLVIFLLFINLSCYRGLIKKQENIFRAEGIVTYKDVPVSGALVEIFEEDGVIKNGFAKNPLMRLKTDSNGQFIAGLRQGNYYFKAFKNDIFSYYGGNPVNISEPKKGLTLKCVKNYLLEEKSDINLNQAELAGKIIDVDGNPLESTYVYLFSAENMDFKRMAEFVSEASSKDGKFNISVDSLGRYFLIVRKRKDAQGKGPLKIGDYYGNYFNNPLEIKDETKFFLIIECIEKKGDFEPSNSLSVPAGKAAFRGKIVRENGNPIEGVFAFAYRNEFSTGKKPDFKSMVTGKDGSYIMIVDEGRYVIGARNTHGGPPEPGDIFGFYEGVKDNKIAIKKDEIKDNVNIIVEDVQ